MKNILAAIHQSSAEIESVQEARNIRLIAKGACLVLAGAAYLLGGPTVGFVAAAVLLALF